MSIFSKIEQIIGWAKGKFTELFKDIPEEVKKYGTIFLTISNTIKTELATPEAAKIEEAIQALFKNSNWEPELLAEIEKGLSIAIPELTTIVNISGSAIDYIVEFIKFLQTLSPKMQHAGLLKFLSSFFQAIDPTLAEVDADTSAQLVYKSSVHA